MQETLNLPTPTTGNPLFGVSNPTFPTKSPTFPGLKPSIFAALSAKSTTTTTTAATAPLPPNPSKFPQLPSSPPPASKKVQENRKSLNVIPTPDPEFQEKALYLDSIGLESLSLLANNPSAAAVAVTSASLAELKALFDYLASFGFSGGSSQRARKFSLSA